MGREYKEGSYDCLDFVLEVLKEEYQIQTCVIPNHGDCTLEQQAELQKRQFEYSEEIEKPEDGCVVLLKRGRRVRHLGMYYTHNEKEYIIHNSSVGGVIQCLKDNINQQMWAIDRYLKWKSPL